jgi:hypothetical protein
MHGLLKARIPPVNSTLRCVHFDSTIPLLSQTRCYRHTPDGENSPALQGSFRTSDVPGILR